MGFPRGVAVHYSTGGEKRQLFRLVEHGDSNPVFDIICFPSTRQRGTLSRATGTAGFLHLRSYKGIRRANQAIDVFKI
jgi:hypothetical protein